MAGRHAAGGRCVVRRAVRGQRPATARAPTCARAATPTSRRSSGTEADRATPRSRRGSPTLNDDVATLTDPVDDREVHRYQRAGRASSRTRPAWCRAQGPGVTVTLSDAPEDVDRLRDRDINLLVVHQQDIQAVVNAMWKGGAEPRSPSRASGSSPPPASSARATPCSSRACPTRSPTSSRRSATRRAADRRIDDDHYLADLPRAGRGPRDRGRLGPRARGRRSPRRRTTACSTSATPRRSRRVPRRADRAAQRLDGVAGDGTASRPDGSGGGRRRRARVGVVGRRGRRLLVRRDHDRHRRALRRRSARPWGSAGSRCPSARWCWRSPRRRGRTRRLRDRLLRVGLLQPDDVRHLLGPVGVEDRDRGCPPARARRRAGVGLEHLPGGLVGLLLGWSCSVGRGAQRGRPRPACPGPTTNGTVDQRLAGGDDEVDRGARVDVLVAVGVLAR